MKRSLALMIVFFSLALQGAWADGIAYSIPELSIHRDLGSLPQARTHRSWVEGLVSLSSTSKTELITNRDQFGPVKIELESLRPEHHSLSEELGRVERPDLRLSHPGFSKEQAFDVPTSRILAEIFGLHEEELPTFFHHLQVIALREQSPLGAELFGGFAYHVTDDISLGVRIIKIGSHEPEAAESVDHHGDSTSDQPDAFTQSARGWPITFTLSFRL